MRNIKRENIVLYYAKENFENMWVQYESLGANGVMSDIHNKFMNLPIDE